MSGIRKGAGAIIETMTGQSLNDCRINSARYLRSTFKMESRFDISGEHELLALAFDIVKAVDSTMGISAQQEQDMVEDGMPENAIPDYGQASQHKNSVAADLREIEKKMQALEKALTKCRLDTRDELRHIEKPKLRKQLNSFQTTLDNDIANEVEYMKLNLSSLDRILNFRQRQRQH